MTTNIQTNENLSQGQAKKCWPLIIVFFIGFLFLFAIEAAIIFFIANIILPTCLAGSIAIGIVGAQLILCIIGILA